MSTKLHWLAPRKEAAVPVTFGVPHSRGVLSREESLRLVDETGKAIPVQTKHTAFWPDGSVKWTAHSAVLDTSRNYSVGKGENAAPASTITAAQDALGNITVESDLLSCRIENGSRDLISALLRKQTAQQPVSAKLVGYLEHAKDSRGLETHELLKFSGITSKVTLEE